MQSAADAAFGTDLLRAPAGQAFSIAFDNQDTGTPHNIYIADACGTHVFRGEVIEGGIKITYHVPALILGSYTFACEIHSFMTGSLIVK